MKRDILLVCGKIKKLECYYSFVLLNLLLKMRKPLIKWGNLQAKPKVIQIYNQSMNGCHCRAQLASYYNSLDRRTCKWWERIFIWLLKVAQVNKFIFYTLSQREVIKSFKIFQIRPTTKICWSCCSIDKVGNQKGRPSVTWFADGITDKKHLIFYDESDRKNLVTQ